MTYEGQVRFTCKKCREKERQITDLLEQLAEKDEADRAMRQTFCEENDTLRAKLKASENSFKLQRGARLLAERRIDDLSAQLEVSKGILQEVAADGCGLRYDNEDTVCDVYAPERKDLWCRSCRARAILSENALAAAKEGE